MTSQLLPCPFCNSSPVPGVKWAQCSNSACPAFHIHTTNLEAWNRRATQPAAGEPVYQWAVGGNWQDGDEKAFASARAAGLETRILWPAPHAAAHGDEAVRKLPETMKQNARGSDTEWWYAEGWNACLAAMRAQAGEGGE